MKTHTQKIVLCAMFTALSAVATMVIQIPSPMSGYVNLGDAFVLLGGFLLGPVYGAIAGGVGSMFADVLTGYVVYAPATFIIKAVMPIVAYYTYQAFKKCLGKKVLGVILGGSIAELIMIVGYFLHACLLLGEGISAIVSVPGNIVQGVFGVVASTLLFVLFNKTNFLSDKDK